MKIIKIVTVEIIYNNIPRDAYGKDEENPWSNDRIREYELEKTKSPEWEIIEEVEFCDEFKVINSNVTVEG